MTTHPPIVLYDGLCGFCDSTVQSILRKDTRGRLRFASLQSEAGQALLAAHGLPADPNTMVLIDRGRAWLRSQAGFRMFGLLGMPWAVLGWLRIVPAWLADPGYRLIAKNRYRLKGKRQACRVPEPGQRERFFETRADLPAGLVPAATTLPCSG